VFADVLSSLAAAAEASKAAGWREVETRCYDALIAACCHDQPIDAIAGSGRRFVPGDAVGQRLTAAFGRDFGPGGQNEDLYLLSRLLGARFHIYGGGGKRPWPRSPSSLARPFWVICVSWSSSCFSLQMRSILVVVIVFFLSRWRRDPRKIGSSSASRSLAPQIGCRNRRTRRRRRR
jgi:hypothetical protein